MLNTIVYSSQPYKLITEEVYFATFGRRPKSWLPGYQLTSGSFTSPDYIASALCSPERRCTRYVVVSGAVSCKNRNSSVVRDEPGNTYVQVLYYTALIASAFKPPLRCLLHNWRCFPLCHPIPLFASCLIINI
jgi:hypothetical protein